MHSLSLPSPFRTDPALHVFPCHVAFSLGAEVHAGHMGVSARRPLTIEGSAQLSCLVASLQAICHLCQPQSDQGIAESYRWTPKTSRSRRVPTLLDEKVIQIFSTHVPCTQGYM